MDLHGLLKRQLKRLGLAEQALPGSALLWQQLLERVSRAYEENDLERNLMERSQELASEELVTLYANERQQRDLLETHVKERTAALHVSEARLSSLLLLSADWIWEQDADLRFTYVSEGIEQATGIGRETLLGQRREFGNNYGAAADALADYEASLDACKPFRDFTFSLVAPNNVKRYVRISGEPVFDDKGAFCGYRGVGRDVTETALAEQKVQELASFDSLTALPNRNMFLRELDRALLRAKRNEHTCAVCFLDLDRFKVINDTLGHSAGDELLKLMAQRLRDALRDSDLVARLGGDEFVVLVEGNANPGKLTRVAQKILLAIAEPVVLQGQPFPITGSVGIALFPQDGQDASTLLKHADAAMYLAKERGKNNLQFYTAELAESAARLFALESELRLAVARQEFTLVYQPRVDMKTGRMRSSEALLRWLHPTRGVVGPVEFIPLAEERGLIVPMGRWVMHEACRQMAAWRQAGLNPPPVAVNLSAKQFASEHLVDDLVQAMALHGVAPQEIEVELTESALMAEPERAKAVLQRFHGMGVAIAIDDFGTGYSSLSYLKKFPASVVKIDRSFIRGLPQDKDDVAITTAVIAMAHSLGLAVVAEGVETRDQLELLRGLGCDEAQGYLLGRPMPAAELVAYMARPALAWPHAA